MLSRGYCSADMRVDTVEPYDGIGIAAVRDFSGIHSANHEEDKGEECEIGLHKDHFNV